MERGMPPGGPAARRSALALVACLVLGAAAGGCEYRSVATRTDNAEGRAEDEAQVPGDWSSRIEPSPLPDWAEAVRMIRLYSAINFLGGKPYPIDVLWGAKGEAALAEEYVFRSIAEGSLREYTLRRCFAEVSRATGKRIVTLSESGESPLAQYADHMAAEFDNALSFSPTRETEFGPVARLPLGLALSALATDLTQMAEPTYGAEWLWAACVGRDCIYLIRMPMAQPDALSPRFERRDQKPATGDHLDKAAYRTPANEAYEEDGALDVPIVLPRNPYSEAVVEAAFATLSAQPEHLARKVGISGEPKSLADYTSAFSEAIGHPVKWYPDPSRDETAKERYCLRAYNTKLGSEARAASVEEWTEGRLIRFLTGTATQAGICRQLPDREVWAALVTDKGILFLLLPNPFWGY